MILVLAISFIHHAFTNTLLILLLEFTCFMCDLAHNCQILFNKVSLFFINIDMFQFCIDTFQ